MEKETLNLTRVNAYAVEAADDEKSSSIKGYYKDLGTASANTKGIGWYGSNGSVTPIVLYEDEEGNVYKVKSLGQYTNIAKNQKEDLMVNIKNKLTPEEQAFLGIK